MRHHLLCRRDAIRAGHHQLHRCAGTSGSGSAAPDVVVNTSRFSVDEAVEVILSAYRTRNPS